MLCTYGLSSRRFQIDLMKFLFFFLSLVRHPVNECFSLSRTVFPCCAVAREHRRQEGITLEGRWLQMIDR